MIPADTDPMFAGETAARRVPAAQTALRVFRSSCDRSKQQCDRSSRVNFTRPFSWLRRRNQGDLSQSFRHQAAPVNPGYQAKSDYQGYQPPQETFLNRFGIKPPPYTRVTKSVMYATITGP